MRSDTNRIIKEIVALAFEREERNFPSLEKCAEMYPYTEMRFLERAAEFSRDRFASLKPIVFHMIRPAVAVLLLFAILLVFPVRVSTFSSDELRIEKNRNGYRAYFGESSDNKPVIWDEVMKRMMNSEYTANEFVPTYIPEGLKLIGPENGEGEVSSEVNSGDPFMVRYNYSSEDYSRTVLFTTELSWYNTDRANYTPHRQTIETYTLPDGTVLYMFVELVPLDSAECYNIMWGNEEVTFSLRTRSYDFEEVLKIIDGIEFVEWTDINPEYYEYLD